MSELKTRNSRDFRWQLLTTVSALALISANCEAFGADANDDHPTLWIELGGQFERQTGQGEMPVPPFVADYPDSAAFKPISVSKLERVPLYSEELEGKITFQPEQSDWVFSAGIRYGRSNHHGTSRQEKELTAQERFTAFPSQYYFTPSGQLRFIPPKEKHLTRQAYEFGGVQFSQSQSHTILDFMAGRDVGLGVLGSSGQSTLNVGVRIAQFRSNSSSTIHARPDAHFSNPCHPSYAPYFYFPLSLGIDFCHAPPAKFHTFAETSRIDRSFRGIGPSVSWDASVMIARPQSDTELHFDWSVNAAVLFGRQKIQGRHQTSGGYIIYAGYGTGYYNQQHTIKRAKRVVVPNMGGMAGVSLRFPNAKISIGYRGDFFFGAMDTGIDTRKTGVTGFYGPFASVSFGFGD